MKALAADRFPGAEQQPLDYPGARPDFSFVYYKNAVYRIVPHGGTLADLRVDDAGESTPLNDFLAACGNAPLDARHAVLAVGSNGCPGRLAEKYAHQPEAALPVLVGTLADTAVVYSRQWVAYGALPATYLHQPGAASHLSLTLLTPEALRRMDETEGVGHLYRRIPVPGAFKMDAGPAIEKLSAYLDPRILSYQGKPVRLKRFAREGPDWPALDERAVLALVLDAAEVLPGLPIEDRHRRLFNDGRLLKKLSAYLDTHMSALKVDARGRLTGL